MASAPGLASDWTNTKYLVLGEGWLDVSFLQLVLN